MSHIDEVTRAVDDFLDAGPRPLLPGLRQDAIEELADLLPPTDDEQGWDAWWPEVETVISRQFDTMERQAEAVRQSCQMTGAAQIGQLQVRIETTFICRTGPLEVRRRQLAGWPTSPHWWVELVTPDGDPTRYTNDQLHSWLDLLVEAHTLEGDWVESERRRLAALRRSIERAASDVAAADQALADAKARRDAAIIAALDGGVEGTIAATAARVTKQRVYQLAAAHRPATS